MPKKYIDLKNVRLSYDPKLDVVRVSSSDPRFKKEAFAFQLPSQGEAARAARKVLESEGVILPLENLLSAKHPTFKKSLDPLEVPLGVDENGKDVSLKVGNNGSPIFITGRPGAGKSCLIKNIAKHFSAFKGDYEVFYTTVSPHPARTSAQTFDINESSSPGIRNTRRRRVLLLDCVDFEAYRTVAEEQAYQNVEQLLKDALKHSDIVFLASWRPKPESGDEGAERFSGGAAEIHFSKSNYDNRGANELIDKREFAPLKGGQAILRLEEDGVQTYLPLNIYKADLSA